MFVLSFKTSKRQIISMILCVIMLIAVIVVAIMWPLKKATAETYAPISGRNDNERIAFLKDLGYEIDSQTPEIKEVLIPDEFDDVFEKYNQIQQQAGMNFKPYHGKRVKCWTYKVLNISGQGEVLANMYVYKDKIIGGDVSSTALNGFMHGLVKYDGENITGKSSTTEISTTTVNTTTTKSKK